MTTVNAHDIGDLVRLSVAITDLAGAAADPTALSLVVTLPGGATKTYGWPSAGPDGSISKDAGSGAFHFDFLTTLPDMHRVHWSATGGIVEVDDSYFFVRFAIIPAGNLCSLLDVKGYLVVQNDGDDWILQRIITVASSFIQQWLSWTIASQVYTETRNGHGGIAMMLKNPFVTAIASLTIDGTAVAASPSPTKAGYTFDDRTVYLRGQIFTRAQQNVVITYTAGLPTVPPELAQCCIDLVGRKYRERSRIGVTSEQVGGQQTVSFSQKDMEANTQTILLNWRSPIPV